VDLANWRYDSVRAISSTTLDTPVAHPEATQKNRALYAQNTTHLGDDTRLTLGFRKQYTSYSADDGVNPATYARAEQSHNINAWEIGVRHNVNAAWSIFGRIGRSFRVATVDETYDQFGGPLFDSQFLLLQPQTSHDSEIGFDYANGSSKLKASLYHMNLNNEIHYNVLVNTFGANMNLSPTRRYGLELQGAQAFTDDFELRAAYTYTVTKFREGIYDGVDASGNDIPLVPRQRIALSAVWHPAEKTALSVSTLYVGKQHFDNDQSNTFDQLMPSYTTTDLKLTQEIGAWSLSASINNLFNEKYFTYGVASTSVLGRYIAYPMAGRNFFGSVQYRY
ncbi:MAG: TonB-dependent receptor, partial [Gallionellaceae bacterium]|nr:TonB-dependent receptor [Gallionellaceae bacterium]